MELWIQRVHLLVLKRCSLVLVLRIMENFPSNTNVLLEWEYSSSCIIIAECWVSGGYWISLWYHNDRKTSWRSASLWYRLLKVKPQGHVTHSGISFGKLSAEFLIFHLFSLKTNWEHNVCSCDLIQMLERIQMFVPWEIQTSGAMRVLQGYC